jgi:RHS repeat-associated protein
MDYFPYGKILRQFIKTPEKYVTTGHERGVETGLDYRGARFYDSDVARFLSLDPLAAKFPERSAYNYVLGNLVMFIDPDGKAPDDFVKREDGSIWDDNDNANDQKTIKEGETYLGKELSFTFNSFIGSTYDGLLGFLPEGDKLTTTIKVSAEENSNGELTKLNASKITKIGKTFGWLAGRDYCPEEGGDNNIFTISRSSSMVNINYE